MTQDKYAHESIMRAVVWVSTLADKLRTIAQSSWLPIEHRSTIKDAAAFVATGMPLIAVQQATAHARRVALDEVIAYCEQRQKRIREVEGDDDPLCSSHAYFETSYNVYHDVIATLKAWKEKP